MAKRLSRHRRFADRLPADVRKRVERAGAREIDWYAGPRPSAMSRTQMGISRTPDVDAEELGKLLKQCRRGRTESDQNG